MSNETTSILKKTIKITGVTCIALGGAALIASGAALKAVTEGAKYLKDTIEKIVHDEPEAEKTVVEADAAEEAVPAAEAVAEEVDFAEEEAQEA